MADNPYQKYKNTQVETASQEKLLLMLYGGAIKFTKQGIKGIKKEDYELANNALTRVQDILSELQATLDPEADAELAANLDALYDYMKRRLIEGNIEKDIEPVEEVLEMLEELNETWKQAAEKLKQERNHQGGGVSIEG